MTNATPTKPVSRLLAETVANTPYAALPAQVVTEAKRAVLDWLGSALAGALEPPARMAQAVVATWGQADDATVFGARRASAAGAALANGVASHILELDDVHKGSTLHGAAPIIPAALAVAEREGASGAAFLLAVVLGYEAALRIGEAVNPSHYRYWHPTGTAATFGAAASAGSLLHLTLAQMLDALGSAGTQAAGLWEFNADSAMSKALHPGKAAFNGVLAADLAKQGFTGATRILEGERGFFRAMSSSYDATRITAGLGVQWKISENCYKLYACCGHTHTAIDTALALREELGWQGDEALAQVQALTIETYGPGYEIVKEMNPHTPYQAKFSLAYVTAAALLEGWVGLEQFTPARFGPDGVVEPTLAALLPRIQVTVNDALSARYPAAWPARLTLILADGTVLQGGSDYPRGNPENPVATTALEEKFRALVAPRYGNALAGRCTTFVQGLERVGPIATAVQELLNKER